jgi:putative transposase
MVKRISHRQACKCVGLNRGRHYYKHKFRDDSEIVNALSLLVEKHVSIGFWQCYYRLRRKDSHGTTKRFIGFIPQ